MRSECYELRVYPVVVYISLQYIKSKLGTMNTYQVPTYFIPDTK